MKKRVSISPRKKKDVVFSRKTISRGLIKMKAKPTGGLEENEVNWGDFEKGKVLSENGKRKKINAKFRKMVDCQKEISK